MNSIVILWSALSGACLMLAGLHVVVWLRNRQAWENLLFSVTVCGVVGVAAGELCTMQAGSPADYAAAIRWSHLSIGIGVAASLGFVHRHFGSGSVKLLVLALGLRSLAVVANFTTGVSLHVREIFSLEQVGFLGESVSMLGEWTPNPWVILGQLAALAQIVYVVHASRRLWKRGGREEKRRALLVGGGLALFFLAASVQAGLVGAGVLRMPFLVSFSFLGVVLVMGLELSRNVLRASRLLRDLQRSEQQLTLAAAAGKMSLWEWDFPTNRIWVNNAGRAVYGVLPDETLDFQRFVATLHASDRPVLERAVEIALAGPEPYAADYRVDLPDGSLRWIAARGKVERDSQGRALRMRGISMDITERKEAELESALHRQELAHLSRVSVLGELSGTLAHELNQPLAAILGNAQVGRRMARDPAPDLNEIAAILDDVADDAKRAGGIIHGMRAMFRKDSATEADAVDLNEAVEQVLGLLHSEVIARRAKVEFHPSDTLAPAAAGRVEVQQVVINLVLNGMDAMKGSPEGGRIRITTSQEDSRLHLVVRDYGPGIPAEMMPRLFEPFATTKAGGLGLGLAISRGIAERFRGELTAENHPEGGALFRLTLPTAGN
jgi:two-component system, LuxR family, sensor kinase FixL